MAVALEICEPFDCPRCGQLATRERFYGPCETCRDALARRRVASEAGDPGVPEGDPGSVREERVHRVPNFVATKD